MLESRPTYRYAFYPIKFFIAVHNVEIVGERKVGVFRYRCELLQLTFNKKEENLVGN